MYLVIQHIFITEGTKKHEMQKTFAVSIPFLGGDAHDVCHNRCGS